MPQLVLSLQSPWDRCSVPGLAKALAVKKELQGQKDTRRERHLPLSPSGHLDCPFSTPPPTSVSLSPLMSTVPALWHNRTPDHPGGVEPSLVTPAAPTDMADVPWEGNTLWHRLAPFWVSAHRNIGLVPVWSCGREEGGCRQGPPAGSWAPATLAWPSPSPSGQWGACSLPGQEDE